jgi:hypothetical protein
MPDTPRRPAPSWQSGWLPDTSRTPGTRRLYVAGALAVATVVSCVWAVSSTGGSDPSAASPPSGSGSLTSPEDLLTFPAVTPSAPVPPSGHSGLTTAEAEQGPSQQGSEATRAADEGSGPRPGASSAGSATAPSKPTAGSAGATSGAKPSGMSSRKSVRSINLSDHYWHVRGGVVRLEAPGGREFREDATFTVVKGLARSSCVSFATHDGRYLRHREFVLRSERDDGSALFRQDATFCPRPSSLPNATMFEAVNYPGRYLRHRHYVLRLDPLVYDAGFRADASFRLVDGLD